MLDEERGPQGTLLLHLERGFRSCPFATLLQHGPAWPLDTPEDTSSPHPLEHPNQQPPQERRQGQQSGQQHGQQQPGSGQGPLNPPHSVWDAGPFAGLPVAIIHMQHPGEVCEPEFLRTLLHELGHALHFLCSSGAAGGAADGTDNASPAHVKPAKTGDGGGEGEAGGADSTGAGDAPPAHGNAAERWGGGEEKATALSGGEGALHRGEVEEEEEEVEGGSWRLPLPPPPKLSAVSCPADVCEVTSHVFEHWTRHPQSLQVTVSVCLEQRCNAFDTQWATIIWESVIFRWLSHSS